MAKLNKKYYTPLFEDDYTPRTPEQFRFSVREAKREALNAILKKMDDEDYLERILERAKKEQGEIIEVYKKLLTKRKECNKQDCINTEEQKKEIEALEHEIEKLSSKYGYEFNYK